MGLRRLAGSFVRYARSRGFASERVPGPGTPPPPGGFKQPPVPDSLKGENKTQTLFFFLFLFVFPTSWVPSASKRRRRIFFFHHSYSPSSSSRSFPPHPSFFPPQKHTHTHTHTRTHARGYASSRCEAHHRRSLREGWRR